MDYKEKYEEALERARALHEEAIAKGYVIDYVKDYETIFPELKESEDERMLREIIRYIREQGNKPTGLPNGSVAVADMLAWLEKQKEQKPAEWSDEDEAHIHSIESTIECNKAQNSNAPAIVEAYEFDLRWLKSLRPQPKCEWGEEDEENFKWFDKFFRAESIVIGGKDIPQDKYLWFKSLRRRPKASDNWKPSEEQMEWLESAVKLSTDKPYIHGIIISLYEQLKRL